MSKIRVVLLWHMHQPFYKDLISGEYRLPWVRMHALKDYYGMVRLLDEFPTVHQTFNLVPSLIAQIQDYAKGSAQDEFLQVVSKPAAELTQEERSFALQYLFQAQPDRLIGRYPRYAQLREEFAALNFDVARAEKQFQTQDYADLQVLSQIAWFDEFYLSDRQVAALIRKGRDFDGADQQTMLAKQHEIISAVLPLLCDSDQGRISSPGLPLPHDRFQHPEDASHQLQRGLQLHEEVFGRRPSGVWPSEGSISEEVFRLGSVAQVR